MLSLLERLVLDPGGSYAHFDSDGMAIVATETGGLTTGPGRPGMETLTKPGFEASVHTSVALDSYDRSQVRGSMLASANEQLVDHAWSQLARRAHAQRGLAG